MRFSKKNLIKVLLTTGDFIIYDILKTIKGKNLNDKELSTEDKEALKIFFDDMNLGKTFSTSQIIVEFAKRMGENSPLRQLVKNDIHVYTPTLCESLIGFYCYDIKIDAFIDVYNINKECFFERKTSAIILGSSVIKHSILNANLFKNGLNSCIIINTCYELDGSDSGADVDEAISWGKINKNITSIKVRADLDIVFPILASY